MKVVQNFAELDRDRQTNSAAQTQLHEVFGDPLTAPDSQ